MFQHALLQPRIDAQAERIQSAYERYGAYFLNADIQRNIRYKLIGKQTRSGVYEYFENKERSEPSP